MRCCIVISIILLSVDPQMSWTCESEGGGWLWFHQTPFKALEAVIFISSSYLVRSLVSLFLPQHVLIFPQY